MAVLVGIDEAGYGPLLGPLVVSSAAFEIPDELLKADMWRLLADSVGRKRLRLGGRLLINDSKLAYNKSIGITHLQRTVLAVLKCLGQNPRTIGELLAILCPDCLERLGGYAWYQRLDLCRLKADEAAVAIASEVFGRNLAKHRIRPLWLKSCCLDVAHYNRMVQNVKNKSNVLFTAAMFLIQHAFENLRGPMLQILVDRQGGRTNYTAGLRRMFPELELQVLREDSSDSSYELRDKDKMMRLHFVVGADERFLPVALASMVCKYVRELLNEQMNNYFLSFNPALRPTAGYWKDGLRFVEDIKKHIPNLSYDRHQLIRSR
jgi:ribonuclease HII